MSQQQEDRVTSASGETPKKNRLRALLREILFIVAIVGIYLAVMLFVLPRLGYET